MLQGNEFDYAQDYMRDLIDMIYNKDTLDRERFENSLEELAAYLDLRIPSHEMRTI